jgi:tRNA G10  N-methylase Trm11
MLRISHNKKKLEKGELRPELANILCRLSEPNDDDVCLDPFCGSGAILLERSRIVDYGGLFNCDIDEENVLNLKNIIKKLDNKKLNKSFFVKHIDFFKNNFDDEFFDKIITDPPWGYYEKIDNIQEFYDDMLREFKRILKPKGIIVLLTANKEELEKAAIKNKLNIVNKYDILVSGKKAGVYKIK